MQKDTKYLTAKLCSLCEQLWPDEWPRKYIGTQEELRDWLNEKTALNVSHITKDLNAKYDALEAWVNAIETL